MRFDSFETGKSGPAPLENLKCEVKRGNLFSRERLIVGKVLRAEDAEDPATFCLWSCALVSKSHSFLVPWPGPAEWLTREGCSKVSSDFYYHELGLVLRRPMRDLDQVCSARGIP